MEIIPVIYILNGRCTALYKGDFAHKKTYGGSPLEWAERYVREGVKTIYLADLNARKSGGFVQKELFARLIKQIKTPVILEADFPDTDSIKEALQMGAEQVVLRSPSYDLAHAAVKKYGPEKIIIQIFARGNEVIENRPKKHADDYTEVVTYAEKLAALGVKKVIYKDRRSEGILTHPDYDEIDRLYLTCGRDLKIYSMGGISEKRHLKLLNTIGASGALIGKAFFERILGLSEALKAVK